MRQTLAAIIAVTLMGTACASLDQDTRMFRGPFGRTEVGAVVIAADPGASKVLVQTYDGDLWIYDVDAAARGRLSILRVGDEVVLTFDDRRAGTRAVAINVLPPGSRPLPPGMLSVAEMLPAGIVFGARATTPYVVATGSGVVVGTSGTVVTAGGVPVVAGGTTFIGPGGTTFIAGPGGAPVLSGPGVVVPGFGSFSDLPSGVLTAQTAVGLGLLPGAFVPGPMGGPSVAVPGGVQPGRTPFTQGNFTPGTITPGVTTANPNAPGQPVVQGPFTPGVVAPGVSQQGGNAPPPAAGATTVGSPGTAGARTAPAPRTGTTTAPSGSTAPATSRPAGATSAPQGGTAPPPQGRIVRPQGR